MFALLDDYTKSSGESSGSRQNGQSSAMFLRNSKPYRFLSAREARTARALARGTILVRALGEIMTNSQSSCQSTRSSGSELSKGLAHLKHDHDLLPLSSRARETRARKARALLLYYRFSFHRTALNINERAGLYTPRYHFGERIESSGGYSR